MREGEREGGRRHEHVCVQRPVAERGGAVWVAPWWARRGGRAVVDGAVMGGAVVGAHMWRLSMPSPRCMCPIPKYRLHCDRPGARAPS